MTVITAEERIAVIAMAVHFIMYPRRHRKSTATFAQLVTTFVDPSIRDQLATGTEPGTAMAVITAAQHCAHAVRRL